MKASITPLQAQALWAVRDRLRKLEPGQPLPSERELAGLSGVGRAVVRRLFSSLRKEHLIARSDRRWILRRRISEIPEPEKGSKRQRAKDFLLSELSSGRLDPGAQISELALAKKVGVSTVSMREALLEIAPLGMLTKKERRQWEVATFSDDRIRELREFREMVEVFCLRKLLAGGLPDTQRPAFEAIHAESLRIVKQRRPTIPEILRADLAFHRLLLESTGSSLIQERAAFIYLIIEFQLVSPFYTIPSGQLGLSQHIRIIEAILREDLPSSKRVLLEHLRSSEQVFCAIARKFKN